MRAALITGLNKLEYLDFKEPAVTAPGAAIVAVELCGICDSEVTAFREGRYYPPVLSGHEFVGTVIDVGEGVTDLLVGDRVVPGAPPACGRCALCRAGHPERCSELTALVFGTHPLTPLHGGYAERIQYPAVSLIRVPDSVTNEQAVMVEPATAALHAVHRCPPTIGDTVVVLGAGPTGLFAAQLLRIAGAGHVIVSDPRERRRELAAMLGADAAVAPGPDTAAAVEAATDGRGADLVYDCVGDQSSVEAAAGLCRPGATIMLEAAASGAIEVNLMAWRSHELTITTSLAHRNHEFDITMDLIASGRLLVDPLQDATIGFNDLGKMIRELADGADHVKVLVDPRR